MSDGFVKLHRSFLKWEWYQDEACRCLFLHLLLTVNWKPSRWMGHEIPAGSAPIGSEALAKELGWNRAKLRRTMDKLKATGEVATKAANKWTLVTLVNWEKYQDDGQQSGQQKDTQTANKRPTNGQQTATLEEGKKERREEVISLGAKKKFEFGYSFDFMELDWPSWAADRVKETWHRFVEYRWTHPKGKFRFSSQRSAQVWLNRQAQRFDTGRKFVAALEVTMSKGWLEPVDPSEFTYPALAELDSQAPLPKSQPNPLA